METKDWKGNRKSVWITNGCTNHSNEERAAYDYYATDPIAVDKLAKKFSIPHRIWECACGGGALSERLKQMGHEVYSTDIVDRGYSGLDAVSDFLDPMFCNRPEGKFSIMTNPPYSKTTEFVLRALDLLPQGEYALFFLKINALESRGRYERIFKNYPPPPNTYFSLSTVCYAQKTGISTRPERSLVPVRRLTRGLCGVRVLQVKQH